MFLDIYILQGNVAT